MTQTKSCLHCESQFEITQDDLDFYTKISPTFAGEKFPIPAPNLCPDCRQRRRLSFRNERNLYRRTCDASGKQIISMYNPECGYKVYDQKIWRSDQWNPMDYGRDFDFTKSFTEQFGGLGRVVPRPGFMNKNCENSDYAPYSIGLKHCYFCIATSYSENCYYGNHLTNDSNCVDVCNVFESEGCYECIDCKGCSYCQFSQYCESCSFCINCFGCTNSHFCINSHNLLNGKYIINNKQSTKEEYDSVVRDVKKEYITGIDGEEFMYMLSDNVLGKNIKESKNIFQGYDVNTSIDCRYLYTGTRCEDVIDCSKCVTKLSIESLSLVESSNMGFCTYCRNDSFVFYSDNCYNSIHLFGCIGLRNKQYCIFNKQYTKEEYEIQVGKIIRHMISTGERGEFFHPSLSPFGYNETVAQEYYPLEIQNSKLQIQDGNIDYSTFGYHRSTYESPKPVSDKVIKGSELPNTIEEVKDDILQFAIQCESSGKLFRIQAAELTFYRKHHIPLPRKHPDVRHMERMRLRK